MSCHESVLDISWGSWRSLTCQRLLLVVHSHYWYSFIVVCSAPSRTPMRRDHQRPIAPSSSQVLQSQNKTKQPDTKTVFPLEQWPLSITDLHRLNRWMTHCASVVYSIHCIYHFFLSLVFSFVLNLLLLLLKYNHVISFVNIIIIKRYRLL